MLLFYQGENTIAFFWSLNYILIHFKKIMYNKNLPVFVVKFYESW